MLRKIPRNTPSRACCRRSNTISRLPTPHFDVPRCWKRRHRERHWRVELRLITSLRRESPPVPSKRGTHFEAGRWQPEHRGKPRRDVAAPHLECLSTTNECRAVRQVQLSRSFTPDGKPNHAPRSSGIERDAERPEHGRPDHRELRLGPARDCAAIEPPDARRDLSPRQLLHQPVDIGAPLCGALCEAEHVRGEVRIDSADRGQQVEPYPHTLVPPILVGRVRHEGDIASVPERHQLLSRQWQQRPRHRARRGQRRQSSCARASQQTLDHGLELVVGGMRRRDPRLVRLGNALEKRPPRRTPLGFGASRFHRALSDDGQSQAPRFVYHERRCLLGVPAGAVIVGGDHGDTLTTPLRHRMQQHHRIASARDCQHVALFARWQGDDGIGQRLLDRGKGSDDGHCRMMTGRRSSRQYATADCTLYVPRWTRLCTRLHDATLDGARGSARDTSTAQRCMRCDGCHQRRAHHGVCVGTGTRQSGERREYSAAIT